MSLSECCCHHRDLHSFPTRRSSDLSIRASSCAATDPDRTEAGIARNGERDVAHLRGALFVRDPELRTTPRAKPSDRKSTRLNSSHVEISYAVFCLKKKNR